MKKYDLYLFDFDGTLVDSLKSLEDVFVLSFRAIGVEIDEKDCLQYTRQPLEETYHHVHAPEERIPDFVHAIKFYLNDEEVLKKTELFPGTKEFLKYMHDNNHKMGIVTSNNEKHVLDVLKFLDIPAEWFCIYVDSDKVPETKPNPKPLLYALDQLDYMDRKEEVVYVGDGLNDMLAANYAGIDAILIDRINAFEEAENYLKISDLFEIIK